MNILVTGVSGQLGHDLVIELRKRGHSVTGVSSKEVDLTNSAAVRSYLSAMCPEAVIHCAGYTAVDLAEDQKEKSFAVNANGTESLASACAAVGCKLLYISTDYVFPGDGLRPWEPEDQPKPLNDAAPLYNYLERDYSLSRSNNIDLIFENIYRARYMLYRRVLRYTKKIARAATNQFLDDCLRYTPELKSIGEKNGLHYRGKLLRIKWRMLGVLFHALITRALSPQSIHGYLIQTILL